MTRGQMWARTAAAVIVSLLLHVAVGAVLLHARGRRAVASPRAVAASAPAAIDEGGRGGWIPLELVDGVNPSGSKHPPSSSGSAQPAAAAPTPVERPRSRARTSTPGVEVGARVAARPPPAQSPSVPRPPSRSKQSERSELEASALRKAEVPQAGTPGVDEQPSATAAGGEHALITEQLAQDDVDGEPRAAMRGPGDGQDARGDGERGDGTLGDGIRGNGTRADGPGGDRGRGAAGTTNVRPQLHRRLSEAARRCYPAAARRFRLTGAVPVSFCVGDGGAPVKVALRGSSGSALLDRSALECVLPGAAPLPGPRVCYALSVEFR